ncbi:MAG TPA: hypothetical protein VLJ16_13705, partial [Acidobacteriota bacterium]|nr:hypothetical protein [Acidobacteriota bacterium]
MTEKIEAGDHEEIDRLIRSEVDQALEKFRAGDFEARVRRLIATEGRPAKKARPLPVKIAVPAAGAVLILAVVAAVMVFRPGSGPGPAPIEAGPIAAVLRE